MLPDMARSNIERDRPTAERIARQFRLEIEEVDEGLVWLFRKTVQDQRFCARLNLSQYDLAPPSLTFCNPDQPSKCGRQWWVKTNNPSSNIIVSPNGAVGNCVRGFNEYYGFHPTTPKSKEDWYLPRLVIYVGDLLDPRFVLRRGV